MRSLVFACVVLCALPLRAEIVVAIAGDSMAATRFSDPIRGWGQMLSSDFTAEIEVKNFAMSGSSTRSFFRGSSAVDGIQAGRPNSIHRWQNLLNSRPDYVLINFGINDAIASDPERYSSAADFKSYLETMIADCRSIGTKPLLITPAIGRYFNQDGTVSHSTVYTTATAEVAAAQNVPLYDFHGDIVNRYQSLGPSGCDSYGSGNPNDRLHFGEFGATQAAHLIACGLADGYPELQSFVVPEPSAIVLLSFALLSLVLWRRK
jgi:lysophospholipase L1-like esterase